MRSHPEATLSLMADSRFELANHGWTHANMAVTKSLCEAEGAQGVRVTTFVADVSDEAAMNAFRDAVAEGVAAAVVRFFAPAD